MERRCYKCGEIKSDFSGSSHSYCRDCWNAYHREWRRRDPKQVAEYKKKSTAKAAANDPEYYRKLTLRKFGLTPKIFDLLLAQQDGRCVICRTVEPGGRHGTWHVDHDRSCCGDGRTCGRCVRGILCQNCNLMLGHAQDDVERLTAAVKYLTDWSSNGVVQRVAVG